MDKEALGYVVGLKAPEIYQVGGHEYSTEMLHRIDPPIYRPKEVTVGSLDAVVKLLEKELRGLTFIEVKSEKEVSVYSSLLEREERCLLYRAKSSVPDFRFDWKDYETAMIAFRSQFAQDEGVKYVLELLSKISDENSVETSDNGLTQTVEVKKGVSLKNKTTVNPIVALRPYRTFLEVEQPKSEFLLRLGEGGHVGLFEADGGMWKLTAKRAIKEYFEKAFAGTPEVVVME